MVLPVSVLLWISEISSPSVYAVESASLLCILDDSRSSFGVNVVDCIIELEDFLAFFDFLVVDLMVDVNWNWGMSFGLNVGATGMLTEIRIILLLM